MTARPTPPSSKEDLLTADDVEQITQIPVGTLKYWRHERRGPRSFKLGRHVRYRRADIDAWLAQEYATTDR